MTIRELFLLIIVVLTLSSMFCADYSLLDEDDADIASVTVSVDSCTDSSVTIRWTRYDDDDFNCYVVLYGTDDIVDWSDLVADTLVFDFDTVKVVRPLDDMTRYYFRVMVVNDEEYFSGSNITDTVTLENMKGKLKLDAPVEIDRETWKLQWSASVDTFDRYELYADTTRTVDTTDSLIATVYNATSETIDSMLFDRTFWVRVYALRDTAVAAKSGIREIYRKQE